MKFPYSLSAAFAMVAILHSAPLIAAEHRVDFDRQIRPILSQHCFHCHGPDGTHREAGLRFDDLKIAMSELESGETAIVPGKPDESALVARILSNDEDEVMPPPDSHRDLSKEQKQLLRQWIVEGAAFKGHWAFQPPHRPELPKVSRDAWPRNEIDSFVLARLDAERMVPSPEARKETLLRRLSLDLTGLPPTLAEVDAFLADTSPDAYKKQVDLLLASPRYGEHMAAEWLDAARYADTNGFQDDGTRTMWPWRDWVVKALNENKPFDEFTIEQLAGDLLPNPTAMQQLATGFHRNHMLNNEGGRIPEESRVDYVVDRVSTTGTIWLGMTVGCARCHDHKYDPFSQIDFYRMYAYFNSIEEAGNVDRKGNAAPVMRLPLPQQAEEQSRLQATLSGLEQQLAAAANTPRASEIQQQINEAKVSLSSLEKNFVETMVMAERKTPRETYRLERGAWDQPDKSQKLAPGVPEHWLPLAKDSPPNRLALARWLVDPQHPLTARVAINRYWQHFFGAGLVNTPDDFGLQGEPPSHPELLDWLATEFIRGGWDVKAMHRLIVTSATYRQSSRATLEMLAQDPYNRLLGRAPRFRMTSQMIRDQALALAGLLVEQVGGPPVRPYQPVDVWSDASLGKLKYELDSGDKLYRRSLYTFWRRTVGPTMLFDASSRQVCTVRQNRTNTPLHALTLMNDITYVEASRKLAERMLREGGADASARIGWALRLATARQATPREIETLTSIYDKMHARYETDPKAAEELLAIGQSLRDKALDPLELAAHACVANVILNLDEVMTRE